jgi:formylglycine-generating enzyme required for sulfatase activity
MSADDRAQLEKQLVYEREKRERAEEAIENLKNAAAERDSAAERIQINLGRYQKYINKTTLYAALGVVLAGFILIIVGFSGRAGMKKKIAEFRPYKDWYDSVSVVSRRAAAERDSLRTELTGLQVRHAAALAEQETLAAAAVQGRANRVDGTAQIRKVDVSIEMVAVQGGTFNMGCTSEQGNDCNDNEKPARSVAVGSFSIGRYPVTQGQWMQVMGSNPSHYRGGNDMPVERVSWRDAQEFITKLNQMTGKRYRLPTEAEWEYAARGGARNRGYKFSGSNHIEEVAWYARTSGTARVGTRKPNELRIFDMSGNVSEWVNDRYGNYDHVPAGDYRVLRGGSWSSVAKSCRVASRAGMPPGTRGNNIGFRLAQ